MHICNQTLEKADENMNPKQNEIEIAVNNC